MMDYSNWPYYNYNDTYIYTLENMDSEVQPMENSWLRKVVYSIRMCFIPIIIAGTITNIMNFYVLSQKEMKCLSTSVYLLALAVADLGIMYLELFRVWFEMMDFVDPTSYFSDLYCKFSNFINGVVRDFSNWLIACLTLERVIMVASPFYAKSLCTVRRAKKITLVLLFALSIPHSHSLIFSVARKEDWWVCWEDPNSKAASVLAATVEITVGYIVVIVVFVLNIILAVLLLRTPKHKQKLGSESRRRLQRRLTRTLGIVAVMFLACETPRIITSFMCRFIQRTPAMRIILNISFVLSGINHASNFWIYIFSSPRFRHIFMKQIQFLKWGKEYREAKAKSLAREGKRTIIKARSVLKENGVLEIHFKLSNVMFEASKKQLPLKIIHSDKTRIQYKNSSTGKVTVAKPQDKGKFMDECATLITDAR